MKLSRWIVAAFAVFSAAAFADNLVPEDKRDFDVPFKGEGKMSLVYTPVFFPKGRLHRLELQEGEGRPGNRRVAREGRRVEAVPQVY